MPHGVCITLVAVVVCTQTPRSCSNIFPLESYQKLLKANRRLFDVSPLQPISFLRRVLTDVKQEDPRVAMEKKFESEIMMIIGTH